MENSDAYVKRETVANEQIMGDNDTHINYEDTE